MPARPPWGRRLVAILLLSLVGGLAGASDTAGALPASRPLDGRQMVQRLYDTTQAAPRWLDGNGEQARLALQLLRDAPLHGLQASDYAPEVLARHMDALAGPEDVAAFERALSAAMLQFLADLHFGRAGHPYRPRPVSLAEFDPVAVLREALPAGRLREAVDAAAPAIPVYRRVMTTLAHYRNLAQQYPHWPTLPALGAPPLRAGDRYGAADQLRERLRLLGDLDPEESGKDGQQDYTPALAAAVTRFQGRHGLEEDGVLGSETAAALAVPPSQRVAQLELTLERLRWVPPLRKGRIIVINVPSYRLWAADTRDAAPQPLEMRVIVGKAVQTPTPLFIGQMRYLEFNPYWNVPSSILAGEILPALARDPAYLRKNDMEVVTRSGAVLSSQAGAPLSALRAGAARVRQRPGARNVLGGVKFAMPNPMDIYLHSTSAQELFARARRDLSHGCIRVERPVELAQFVLADPGRWDGASVAAAMRDGRTRRIDLGEAVPVVLFYATAASDREGRALFANDIYGQDEPLIRALRSR
ncbi:L,D-transpeptidase family protein [Massilia sp. ST3]|uniref:L,D-transpeptidase family protein n=1 Tax=Massilia sp. ST3 TaxID=2824903 RepID=UPI001B80F009|nr:L,D-transpeptidase family protein [Massilia sp. ST3]